MWRHLQQISTNAEQLSTDSLDGEQNIDASIIIRQLLVWIHAAAFEEAHDVLSSACEKNTDTSCSAHFVSREGQLAKLELIGSKVYQLLQKVLVPANLNSENSRHLNTWPVDEHDDPGEFKKKFILENGNWISTSAVASLVVKDPCTLTKEGNVIDPDDKPLGSLVNEECQSKEQHGLSLPEHEAEIFIDHDILWDASKEVNPPVEESVLCMEKHHQRKEFIFLAHRSSGPQNASVNEKYPRSCPILLLKNDSVEESIQRCSIVLPLSWVKAFWDTLLSNGAQAIGLREKHWVACEIGLPCFPIDFPDCKAYSHLMAMEALAANHKSNALPPSKRPVEVPIPPPWNSVHRNFVKRLSKAGFSCKQTDELSIQDENINDVEENFGCGESHTKNSNCHNTLFKGTVARTSLMLSDDLNKISGNDFLLFPRIPGQKNCLYRLMKDKEFPKQDTVESEVRFGKTPCYLRVLLCAFKEGMFEQGAVVCAPLSADIMMFTSSSECEDQQLQVPQSSLKSYFVKLPSGEWELQMPEDKGLCESHRWPIGFVTTGFIRGSKKAMAGALCEATLLSQLREEQWKASPVRRSRKQIYVLVRNLRSTAYRLALATIVLEQQEEDVDFM